MNSQIEAWLKAYYKHEEGTALNPGNMGDSKKFARELGMLLYHLKRLDQAGAPGPSFENAFAGSELSFFEAEFADLLANFKELVPSDLLVIEFDKVVNRATEAKTDWLHGDFWPENILVKDGKIQQVRGFDKAVVGNPSADLAIAWSLFDVKERKVFFSAAEASQQSIDEARLYALRHALKNYHSEDIDQLIMSRDSLTEVLKDYGFTGDEDLRQ
ncbi:phosphotransferase [Lactococcus termiticola]|uniref:Putative aminoglycoside phosphotransferase n=1 Tax=Lactococcus termiticola TaxID=2169526 RepID=A0A2R5HH09_9LACT|nr:phosphotransferase [Lactococcus termiticola]GBG97294.1 putative aminoglycoside phosphotransferase [Lactococcus termiticola]